MKSYFAIAFVCVYLTLAVGVAKTTHYCMGRENHSTLFSFYTDPCFCFKLSGGTSNCCDNESVLLQIDDDRSVSNTLSISPVDLPLLEELSYSIIELPTSISRSEISKSEVRPPPLKVFIKNCSFIFYDDDDDIA